MILGLKSPSIISRWERGQSYPSLENAFRLAIIYRTIPDALYSDYLADIREEVKVNEELLNH